MTEEITTSTPPSYTAGTLLRQYREAQGFKLDVLAQNLRVAPAKLQALEADRLEELPDAVFARALTLAVCRQLKQDAAPVLALLPGQDVSRLAPKDERGLDFPLERPSFLPQPSLVALVQLFTPMRWAALALLVLALFIGWWPDMPLLSDTKDQSEATTVLAPVESPAVAASPAREESPAVDKVSGNVVLTTVHSSAVAAQAASATSPAMTPGASDGK